MYQQLVSTSLSCVQYNHISRNNKENKIETCQREDPQTIKRYLFHNRRYNYSPDPVMRGLKKLPTDIITISPGCERKQKYEPPPPPRELAQRAQRCELKKNR